METPKILTPFQVLEQAVVKSRSATEELEMIMLARESAISQIMSFNPRVGGENSINGGVAAYVAYFMNPGSTSVVTNSQIRQLATLGQELRLSMKRALEVNCTSASIYSRCRNAQQL